MAIRYGSGEPVIRTFNDAMQERFGTKIYRLALDGGMTCPNRDGTLGTGGCIFCSGGSGAFAEGACGDIETQLSRAMERVRDKAKNARYAAYFQSYTNTYAPVSRLRELFEPVLAHPEVAALAIGTRPDCLGEDVMDLLRELNEKKPVWVELGLQTIHEKTAEYIRRGYPLSCFTDAMERLRAAGLETVVHVILGLPGETEEMMYDTVSFVAHSGAAGIKLQLLHILRGTDLCEEYLAGKVRPMEMEEYIRILAGCVRRLPPDMVIHRMTGDGAKRELIAPLWSGDKKRVLNAIHRYFQENRVEQGSLFQE